VGVKRPAIVSINCAEGGRSDSAVGNKPCYSSSKAVVVSLKNPPLFKTTFQPKDNSKTLDKAKGVKEDEHMDEKLIS